MRLTHQTWLRPITIYLHRWDTRLLSSASLLRCRWLVWLKRATIFLAWPQIVKQVEKMYSYRWAILRIKYFLSFSCNKRIFSIKKFLFHIYISDINESKVLLMFFSEQSHSFRFIPFRRTCVKSMFHPSRIISNSNPISVTTAVLPTQRSIIVCKYDTQLVVGVPRITTKSKIILSL